MEQTNTPTAVAEAAPPQSNRTYVWGVGRRKSAVARVRIAPGTGKIELNGRTLNEFLTSERDRKSIFGPLEVTNTEGPLQNWSIFILHDRAGSADDAGKKNKSL